MINALSGLGAVLLWGVAPVAVKSLVVALPGLLTATAIYVIAAVITLPWLIQAWRGPRAPWRVWRRVIVLGFMLTSTFTLLISLAAPSVQGTTIGAVVALEPLMVALLTAWVTRRWPMGITWAALLLSLAGAWLLIGPAGESQGVSANASWAIGLVVLGALLWSSAVVMISRLHTPWPPLQTSMVLICCGSLPFVAAAPFLSGQTSVQWTFGIGSGVLFMAVGVTVMANVLWLCALRAMGPVPTSLLLNLTPLTTVALSVLWLGEDWGPRQLTGTALVLAGVSLLPLLRAYQQRRRACAVPRI